MTENARLETIYTADEAAEKLKLTRRAVITNGKRYGLCFEVGRHVRFTETQLVKLVDAMQFKPSSNIQHRYVAAYQSGIAFDLMKARLQETALERKRRQEKRRSDLAAERERRRVAEAADRERRLEAKRQLARQREEAKAAKRAERCAERLDPTNRDPEYWTKERKELLRQEREARLSFAAVRASSRSRIIGVNISTADACALGGRRS